MSSSYELIEVVGTSTSCSCDAVKSIVKKANEEKTVYWFEVVEERGKVTSDGEVEFQVKVKIGRKI